MSWEIRQGDALERLREMPDESVQCCVTSPPYFGLRDYGIDGQIGLEPTPDEYVARLAEVFHEVRRVLRDDGTLWLNLGDSYAGSWGNQGRKSERGTQRPIHGEMLTPVHDGRYPDAGSNTGKTPPGVKPKDLLGIPWLVAFALQADGWWLRSDIIWAKPSPMPESVTDRPTRSHEYVFLFAKSQRYYWDAEAIREDSDPAQEAHNQRYAREYDAHTENIVNGAKQPGNVGSLGIHSRPGSGGRNRRSVWTIATKPYPEAHFAVFPPALVEPCVLAGSSPQACGECGAPWERVVEVEGKPAGRERNRGGRTDGYTLPAQWENGENPTSRYTTGWQPTCSHSDDSGSSVVLDPFAGAGTTGVVALRHDRSFIGIELNADYCELARNRIRDDAPLMNTVSEVAA